MMAERYSHAWSTTALLDFNSNDHEHNGTDSDSQERQPKRVMQQSWSTTALRDFSDGNNSQDHQPRLASTMQPSPSLSQLIKRRRRRCGGIFKPTDESSSSGLGLEYDWPYHQSPAASIPNLSIDTGRVNEAFFRQSRTEFDMKPQTQMTRAGSAVELSGDGERGGRSGSNESKYDFERDVEGAEVGPETEAEDDVVDGVMTNIATTDGASTRSTSVYSQESLDLEREMSAFRHRRQNKSKATDHERPRPGDVEQDTDAEISVPKARRSVLPKPAPSYDNQAVITREKQPVNNAVKLPRSTSTPFATRFGSIRQVSNKLLTRTASITESVTEKVNNFKIRTSSAQRTRSGREGSGSSAGSSEVANGTEGQHSLGGNVGHGPTHSELARDHATRHVSVSSKRNGRRQRRVY